MVWIATKTYSYSRELTCCYRQWNATDKISRLHGTNLSFKMVFECHKLDEQGRVIDFSQLTHIDEWLRIHFDHTTCVSQDDPHLDLFRELHQMGIIEMRIVHGVGPEHFAEMLFKEVMTWLRDSQTITRATIRSVECSEHEGYSALYVE